MGTQQEWATILAVGDTSVPAQEPESIFAYVKDVLAQGDVRFAQVERVFSTRGTYQLQGIAPHVRRDPECAKAYTWADFDVVSAAGNHTGDWGPEAVEDTVETFRELGIATVGTGKNIAEARKPAVFEKKGVRIAVLGYASVLLPQYWATEERAGAAPLRAHTYYEPYEYQPGSPPRIVTVPYEEDVAQMVRDIRNAKETNDVVVVSIHWGVHYVPKPLADYQPLIAKAAVEAGADVILGHHAHCLQGLEVMRSGDRHSVVFYNLGNFACPRIPGSPLFCLPNGEYEFADVYTKEMEAGYTYEWNRFWAESGIANIQASKEGLEKVTFMPTLSEPLRNGQPQVLSPDDAKFQEIREHLKWASAELPGRVEMPVVEGELLIYERA